MQFRRMYDSIVFVLINISLFVYCSPATNEIGGMDSNDYGGLVSLFNEFCEFRQPEVTDGVPDYSAVTMENKFHKLKTFQNRLAAINPSGWPISKQSDYHLVRAEMNGYEFQHRVQRPWSIDPGFYADLGPSQRVRWPTSQNLPLENGTYSNLSRRLKTIPGIVEQAKVNLNNFSEISADLGTLAVLSLEYSKTSFESLLSGLPDHHSELVSELEETLVAVNDYIDWIETNKDKMTARGGVGKENYNWLLKNVYLLPYTWEDVRTIVELEDNRVITFQRFEENRNRNVSAIKPAQSQSEYKASVDDALEHIMNFLRRQVLTGHDDVAEVMNPQRAESGILADRALARPLKFVLAPATSASSQSASSGDLYFRAGLALDLSEETRFQDNDCSSTSPAALYGCGKGIDGAAPLASLGDFGTMTGFELGIGYVAVPALRLEAVIEHRPNFSFDGRANFVQTAGRQEVSANLSSLSGMLAAYLDLPELGLHRLGPFSPFIGGGVGLSRIDIDETLMEFPRTTTIIPSGRQINLAWMLMAGIAASVAENLTLDIAWRYTDSGAVETGTARGRIVWRDGSRAPLEIDLAGTRANLSSHGLRVSLRYAF